MVEVAVLAEECGFSAVWVNDHFSGAVVGAPWSRDPCICLGAFAVATDDIGLGLLVANIVNRHPAQLASAVNSLQSLAPGRLTLGVGSGAAPGSRFAVEHEAIGRELGDVALVVGASAWPTIEVATRIADGVNIRRTNELASVLRRLARSDAGPRFEVSVLDDVDPDHPLGGEYDDLVEAGVERRVLTVSAPFDRALLERLAVNLGLVT